MADLDIQHAGQRRRRHLCVNKRAVFNHAGAGRSVSYTAFNMADTITQGATTVAFAYDSEHQRVEQCIGSSCATSATWYLNDRKRCSGPTFFGAG